MGSVFCSSTFPDLPGVFEVLLRVDFNVSTGRIDVNHFFTGFDHLLQEVNQIRFLEEFSLSKGFARIVFTATMILFPQPGCAVLREFGDANVFPVCILFFDFPVNPRDEAVATVTFSASPEGCSVRCS